MWKDIKNYEGYYQISDSGEVRSLDRVVERSNGSWVLKGQILKPALCKSGYMCVALCKDGVQKTHFIHHLVAENFLGEKPSEDMEVNHINANRQDNRVENLEWMSRFENRSIAGKGKTKNALADNHNARKVTCITTGETFRCIKEFALKHNLNYSAVMSAVRRGHKTIYGYEINFD